MELALVVQIKSINGGNNDECREITFPWDKFVLTFSTTFFCVKYFLLKKEHFLKIFLKTCTTQ